MTTDGLTANRRPAMPGPQLVGRAAEQAALDQLLVNGRAGLGAALLLHGDQGIGKTALLDYAVRQAPGYRVVRVHGVESEMDLPYAGVQLLCASLADHLRRVPSPQREALETAGSSRPGSPQDRFLIGLGLHELFSVVAESQPVLCVVDNAEWLDQPSVQVLTFVARRLTAEAIVLVIAQSRREHLGQVTGLSELALEPLSDASIRTIFAAAVPGRMDHAIRTRIVAEARGNPRALLEFLEGVSPADFAGGLGLTAKPHSHNSIPESLRTRLDRLPDDSRQLLVVAASEPVGDPALMWRAAATLGLPTEALAPLEADGLLLVGARVLFTRPLLRSLVHGASSSEERRRTHQALAAAAEQTGAGDRSTWHRAHAGARPDEHIAAELERCAVVAREQAGVAASAALLERSAQLTSDVGRRADRAVRAVAVKLAAGDPQAAARLALLGDMGPIDQARKDQVRLSWARIAAAQPHSSDAPELLLAAARDFASAEPALAREVYVEALASALRIGRFSPITAEDVGTAAQDAPAASHPPRAVDLLLDALAGRFTKGYLEAVAPLRDALDALRRQAGSDGTTCWLSLAGRVARDLWDDESWHALTALQLRAAREADVIAILPDALGDRALVDLYAGEFSAADALISDAETLAARMDRPRSSPAALLLAAWRGHDAAIARCDEARLDARERSDGTLFTAASYATSVLHNARRRYENALTSAQDAAEFEDVGLHGWVNVELIEAAVRHARPDVAAAALEQLSDRTDCVGTEWAAGTTARCRALVSPDGAAEALYLEAIERLQRSRVRTDLARAQLLYGEWLRRQGRRLDSRAPLRRAREAFVVMGADAFAQRAHIELLATGETARSRAVDTQTQLTPQETRVAFLARDGLTNPEIGEQLFVSPKTVEYHLHKVFTKLRITSRKELHLALADSDDPLAAVLTVRPGADSTDESQCA